MTALKKQAVIMVESIPDDKMLYVVDMLRSITGIIGYNASTNNKIIVTTSTNSPKQEAWNRLQKYKGIISHDIDEKAELEKAKDEKYASSI